jgi:hypothetical protein
MSVRTSSAWRGDCGGAADGVVDQVLKINPEFAKRMRIFSIHHPGASRHPSWPGGVMGQELLR